MLEKLLDEFHPSQPEIARTKALASLHVGGQILTYRGELFCTGLAFCEFIFNICGYGYKNIGRGVI